jgi:hypothetical protein
MSYTKGKWSKNESGDILVNDKIIASAYINEKDQQLFFAAPQLLRTLEICVKLLKDSGFSSNDDQVAEAEDAIKQAVG